MNKIIGIIDTVAIKTLDFVYGLSRALAVIGMIFVLGVLLLVTILQFYSGSVLLGFVLLGFLCFLSLLVRSAFL